MCLLHNDGSSLGGGYRHPIFFPRGLRGVVDNRVPVHVFFCIHFEINFLNMAAKIELSRLSCSFHICICIFIYYFYYIAIM